MTPTVAWVAGAGVVGGVVVALVMALTREARSHGETKGGQDEVEKKAAWFEGVLAAWSTRRTRPLFRHVRREDVAPPGTGADED